MSRYRNDSCQYVESNEFFQRPIQYSYLSSNQSCCQPCPPCPPFPPPPCPTIPASKPAPINGCFCADSIRQALQAIQAAISKTGIPGFQVEVVITTKSGIQYTIPFSLSIPEQVVVGQEILTYEKIAISLCDIAKIDILNSQVVGTSFSTQLVALLNQITTVSGYCGCGSGTSCENCNIPGCCCAPGMQDYAYGQKTNISAVNYNGALQNIESISAVTTIVSTTVMDNVIIQPTNVTVLSGATANTATVPVISALATVPVTAITNMTTVPQTIVTNVIGTTTTALAGISATPTTVVTGVTTVPNTFIGVTATTTILAAGPISVTATTVATGLSTVPATLLSNVTNTLTSVAAPVSISSTTIVTGATTATIPVVTAIATVPETVVSTFDTIPVTVNTAYPNPPAVNGVVSGLATATSVATQQEVLPVITAAVGGLFVNVNGATLPVLDSAGNHIIIGAPININVVSSSTNLLGGLTNAPALTNNVLTGLGVPTTTQLISNVVPTTVTALANATATTTPLSYLSSVTTGRINAVAQTPTTVTVVSSIATVPQTITTVGSATLQSVNLVNGTPATVNVLSSITTIPQIINSVGAVTQGTVSAISGTPSTVTVVNAFTTVAQTVSSIASMTPTTLTQITGVTSGSAVGSVTLTNTTANAVKSVSALPQLTSVIQSVGASTINVMAPVTLPINGTVETVGGGIMVVSLPNNDISLLSLCDVQSIETE